LEIKINGLHLFPSTTIRNQKLLSMENQNKRHTQLEILKDFEFAKTPVMACMMHTGEMIALRPCVENLGLNWSGQLQAIKRNEKIDQLCASVKALGKDGKKYDMVCLPPAAFQEWLWNLNSKSENLNIPLWEEYKKGLVLHILMMLKISLDEVTRLKIVEADFTQLKKMVVDYFKKNELKNERQKEAREYSTQEKELKDSIKEFISKDPNQLGLNLILN
jgi:hypothetical protein